MKTKTVVMTLLVFLSLRVVPIVVTTRADSFRPW